MSPRRSDPFSLEFILLGFLSGQPMHGYDLHRAVLNEPSLADIWHVKQSLLYALLEKLEAAGYLESHQVTTESIIPRREYSITPEGGSAFKVWLSLPVEHPRDLRQEFLAKLFFAEKSGQKEALNLVRAQKQNCQGWLEHEGSARSSIIETGFPSRVASFRRHQAAAALEWLAELEVTYRQAA